MEEVVVVVPVISRLSSSSSCPSMIISGILDHFLGKSSSSTHDRFFKWGSLLLALCLFSFTNLASRLKLLFLQIFHQYPARLFTSSNSPTSSSSFSSLSINLFDDDDALSSDDDDDYEEDDAQSSSDEEEDESDDDDESEFEKDDSREADNLGNHEGQNRNLGNTRSRRLRGSFGESLSSLTEQLTCNVVKLWDDSFNTDTFFTLDSDHNLGFPAVGAPGVIVTAESADFGKIGVKFWDSRVRRRRPAAHAEWPAEGLVVGDMRKVDSPLRNLTEEFDDENDDTWRDVR